MKGFEGIRGDKKSHALIGAAFGIASVFTNQDAEGLCAPFFGHAVRIEEHVKSIALDDAASILYRNNLVVVVARNDHFDAEAVHFVRGDEDIPLPDAVIAGGNSIGEFSAADRARAIGRDVHLYDAPALVVFEHIIDDVLIVLKKPLKQTLLTGVNHRFQVTVTL